MGKLAVCCSTQLFVNLSICPIPTLQGGGKCSKIHPNTKYEIYPNILKYIQIYSAVCHFVNLSISNSIRWTKMQQNTPKYQILDIHKYVYLCIFGTYTQTYWAVCQLVNLSNSKPTRWSRTQQNTPKYQISNTSPQIPNEYTLCLLFSLLVSL